jgi:hypothetical protein
MQTWRQTETAARRSPPTHRDPIAVSMHASKDLKHQVQSVPEHPPASTVEGVYTPFGKEMFRIPAGNTVTSIRFPSVPASRDKGKTARLSLCKYRHIYAEGAWR